MRTYNMYKYFPPKEQLKKKYFGKTKVGGGAWLLGGPHNVEESEEKVG
jgi:hypothetical protein